MNKALLSSFLAWLVPGAGHLYLGRRGRAAVFFAIIAAMLVIGVALHGNLYSRLGAEPLPSLLTLATMGMGVVYFVLRLVAHYAGDMTSAGYDYGTAFLITAGLMNILLVLDCWDIANGRKE